MGIFCLEPLGLTYVKALFLTNAWLISPSSLILRAMAYSLRSWDGWKISRKIFFWRAARLCFGSRIWCSTPQQMNLKKILNQFIIDPSYILHTLQKSSRRVFHGDEHALANPFERKSLWHKEWHLLRPHKYPPVDWSEEDHFRISPKY